MNTELDFAKQYLSIPVVNTSTNNESNQSKNEGNIQVFTIANVTRNILYRYATIGSTGNIAFHAMAPFAFLDDTQQAAYKKKTTYVSVNTETAQNTNNPSKFNNNNLGNFLLMMKPNIVKNGKTYNNPYSVLTLHTPVIKNALIPASIDLRSDSEDLLSVINAPAIELQNVLREYSKLELENKERVNLNIEAFKVYEQQVLALVEQGLLTFSQVLINPKRNSISINMGLEDSMKSISNPWLNVNELKALGFPLSDFPVLNNYVATVQIIEGDMSLFLSNNDAMLGKRSIYTNEETNKSRESLSVIGIIKDYNSDTPILINITDTGVGINNPDSSVRGRVEAFEGLLDKGLNTFTFTGHLVPVVRLIDSNASRNGNIFFELVVSKYDVYLSNTTRNTLEADTFGDLAMDELDGDISVETLVLEEQQAVNNQDNTGNDSNTSGIDLTDGLM